MSPIKTITNGEHEFLCSQVGFVFAMYLLNDTIVAISSAPGPAPRGIIRLSGPEALRCVGRVFQGADENRLEDSPGWAVLPGRCRLSDHDPITCPAQLYLFRSPHSYTTEDMAELHLPGSPSLLGIVLEALLGAGVRPAGPGEFTARAFLNGRIDLTEAEAIAAVIGARSDRQLRAAEKLLDGQLHRLCSQLTERLSEFVALVEAEIDFSDQDIEFASLGQLRRQIESIYQDLDSLLSRSITWDQLSHLPQLAVAGPANAGKSSLVNSLLGINRSIVSAIAGTTRDLLTAPLKLPHGECMLIDTAGLGDVTDPLSEKTQRLSRRAIATCDLLLWVLDASTCDLSRDRTAGPPAELNPPENVIVVANKIDLCPNGLAGNLPRDSGADSIIEVSALRGDNLDALKLRIDKMLRNNLYVDCSSQTIALTARQRQRLLAGRESLGQCLSLLSDDETVQLELVALELRSSLDSLASISGAAVTEDILGRIFSRFCVGK